MAVFFEGINNAIDNSTKTVFFQAGALRILLSTRPFKYNLYGRLYGAMMSTLSSLETLANIKCGSITTTASALSVDQARRIRSSVDSYSSATIVRHHDANEQRQLAQDRAEAITLVDAIVAICPPPPLPRKVAHARSSYSSSSSSQKWVINPHTRRRVQVSDKPNSTFAHLMKNPTTHRALWQSQGHILRAHGFSSSSS